MNIRNADSQERRISLRLFVLFCVIYFLSAKGHLSTYDSYTSLLTTRSILERGSLQIHVSANELHHVGVFQGKMYSKYGIALPILWIPYVLAGKCLAFCGKIPEDFATKFLLSFYNIFLEQDRSPSCSILRDF